MLTYRLRNAIHSSRLGGIPLGLALLASTGFGAPFTNGSFEQPGAPGNARVFLAGNDTFVSGWTHVNTGSTGSLDIYVTNNPYGISADTGASYVAFGGNGSTGGILFQTFDTLVGSTYTVNYRLTTQQLNNPPLPLQSILVEALDGNTVLNSVGTAFNPAAGVWINGNALSFIATSTSSTLRFTDTSDGNAALNINWGLDTVTVDVTASTAPAIPEPATIGLISSGLVLALLRRRTSR